jgi:hypothetical protein
MARRKVASQARRRSAAGAPERFNVGGLLKGIGRLPMPRGLSPVAERDITPLLLESDIALPLFGLRPNGGSFFYVAVVWAGSVGVRCAVRGWRLTPLLDVERCIRFASHFSSLQTG